MMEDNDPNIDRKRKKPHEDEVIPTKNKRTPWTRGLVGFANSSKKIRKAPHLHSSSGPLDSTQPNAKKNTTTF